MAKIALNKKNLKLTKNQFFSMKGAPKNYVVAQMKAIEISFQMIWKRFPLTSTRKTTQFLVEPHQNLGINKIPIVRPIFF